MFHGSACRQRQRGDVRLAPKAELQAHKAAFREVFGKTLSDEFVDEMLTHLDALLAPGTWNASEPGTLNAAIAFLRGLPLRASSLTSRGAAQWLLPCRGHV
jgi:hypothetical protein